MALGNAVSFINTVMFSLDDINRPMAGPEPAGWDLALTGEILELELLAKPVPVTNMDGKRVAGDFSVHDPDWSKLQAKCEELLQRSRDLRVAMFYCAALLRVHRFLGFSHGLEIVRRMMRASEYRAYPQLEAGDRSAFFERWFTIVALGAPYKQEGDLLRIIEGIRTLPLSKNKSFPCSYLDVVAARNQSNGADSATIERLRNGWETAPTAERSETGALLTSALRALAEIEEALLEQTPEEFVPVGGSTKPLALVVREIGGLLEFVNGSVSRSAATSVEVKVEAAISVEIRTRDDAIRLLQQAAEFFRKTEPSSPIPYFVDRAIRLVDRNFMGLLSDLVPDAVPRFQSLVGAENGGTSSS